MQDMKMRDHVARMENARQEMEELVSMESRECINNDV